MSHMQMLVSDCDHTHMHEESAVFQAAGLSYDVKQCKTEDDLISQCKGATVLLNQYAPMTRRVLEALHPELKMVVRYGVGVNNVDMAAATELQIRICNVPDYGMHEVSDHALALTLDLARKIVFMNAAVRHGRWDYAASVPLYRLCEQTMGIVGLGRNGRLFAEKARPLFGKMAGYDPYYTPNAKDGTQYIQAMDLQTLLAEADYVVLNLPLTPETHNIIDARALARMKKTACLINVSRGGLVDEKALEQALAEKRLGGAALDVTEKEPLGESPLLHHDNFVCTPHMAWYSEQAASELKRKVAEEAVRFMKGEDCPNWLNRF